MAVVQISRIQVRRGKRKSGSGIPQLASGELAWAIDDQQLYIGNGSVAEGAPAVGNTKVLTENDLNAQGNILNLIQHIYKSNEAEIQTGPNINSPITRYLQDRLDDRVTTKDFGVIGNGSTDDTQSLQRAINQLFINTVTKENIDSKITLEIPAGTYKITGTLFIPSGATIVGAGAGKTIISHSSATITGTTNSTITLSTASAVPTMIGSTITGSGIPVNTKIISVVVGTSITLSNAATTSVTNSSFVVKGPIFRFVNDTTDVTNNIVVPSIITTTLPSNQPRNIILDGLTLTTTTTDQVGMKLDCVANSIFSNIEISSIAADFNFGSRGIELNAALSATDGGEVLTTTTKNLFTNITVKHFSYGIYSRNDITYNTIKDSYFENLRTGIVLGGDLEQGDDANGASSGEVTGPIETFIENCRFYNIKRQAVYVERGTGNNTSNCRLEDVGNDGAGAAGALYPQIFYRENGNIVHNLKSDRHAELATLRLATPYVPEVGGSGTYTSYGIDTTVISSLPGTPQDGQYWLDTDDTVWGLYEYNGTAWISKAVRVSTGAPPNTLGVNGEYAIDASSQLKQFYKRVNAEWKVLSSAALGSDVVTVSITAPSTPSSGDVWLKVTTGGLNIKLKKYSSATSSWSLQTIGKGATLSWDSDITASTGFGVSLSVNSIYLRFTDENNAKFNIRRYTGTVWATIEPTTGISDPTLAFRLPVNADLAGGTDNGSVNYKINYTFKSIGSSIIRTGLIDLSVLVDMSNNTKLVQLSDEYNYIGPSEGDVSLDFRATLLDELGNPVTNDILSYPYSVAVRYLSDYSGGILTYSYTAII